MPEFTQRSLAGGEIAPALHSRVDLNKYQSAVAVGLNAFVHVEGGLSNRAGWEFIAEVKDSTKVTRLIEFEFNTEQAYALEVGDLYMRPIKDGGRVLETSAAIVSATQANPVNLEVTGHGYTTGEEVYVDGGGDMTEINSKFFTITVIDPNNFTIGVDGTAYTAYTSGGTVARVYELTTTYTEAILNELKYTQSADTMTLVQATFQPRELTRTDHDAWSIADVSFAPTQAAPTGVSLVAKGTASGASNKEYQYTVTAVNSDGEESLIATANKITQNALSITYGVTVSWTAPAGGAPEYYNVYKAASVDSGVYGFIGRSNGLTFDDFNIEPDMSLGPLSANDPFDGSGNKPSVVNHYQQRTVYGATNNKPQSIFASESGNGHSMRSHTPVVDSDYLQFGLASKKVNRIRHILDLDLMLVLTSGGEWKVTEGDNEVLSPSTVGFKKQSENGASEVDPLTISDTALYVQEKGARVRDFAYTFESDKYTGSDLTVLARHLFDVDGIILQITDWTYQKEPYGIVWAIRSDGVLLSLTYQREQQVWAWCRHTTDGVFESICTIPEGNEDVVYAVIKRTINGTDKRYIERMHSRQMRDVTDAFFVDSGLSYDSPLAVEGITAANPPVVTITGHGRSNGDRLHFLNVGGTTEVNGGRYLINNVTANTFELQDLKGVNVDGTGFTAYTSGGNAHVAISSISNVDHLEGKTVNALCDGMVVSDLTVTNGTVTLPFPAGKVHLGLPYVSDIGTLDIDSAERTFKHVQKSVGTVHIDFKDSRGGWVGPDVDNLLELKPRAIADGYGVIPLRTHKESITVSPKWSDGGRIYYRQVDPLPFTILSITPEFDAG